MGKYVVEFTDELWKRVVVVADSEDDAREKFWLGEFDVDAVEVFGGELDQDIDVSLEEEK